MTGLLIILAVTGLALIVLLAMRRGGGGGGGAATPTMTLTPEQVQSLGLSGVAPGTTINVNGEQVVIQVGPSTGSGGADGSAPMVDGVPADPDEAGDELNALDDELNELEDWG